MTSDVSLTIESDTSATINVRQTWEGESSSDFRQSLDVIFGDGDGALSKEEITRIARATEGDVRNKSFPMVGFDGVPSVVTDVTLTIEGGEGDVKSKEPITTTHALTVSLQSEGNASHRLTVNSIRNGTLTVRTTNEWVISRADGSGPGTATFSTTLNASDEMTLLVGPASAITPPGPNTNESTNEQEAVGTDRGIPALGPVAIMLITLTTATAMRARRTRREG